MRESGVEEVRHVFGNKNSNVNIVTIVGKVVSEPVLDHTIKGDNFFLFNVSTARLSGVCDIIPVIVSEIVLGTLDLKIDADVLIKGDFRSKSIVTPELRRLKLYVFAFNVVVVEARGDMDLVDKNVVHLTGFVCKPAYMRRTPKGREIADVILAVNRRSRKSDYIPCLAWGANADYVSSLPVGTELEIRGRIQSRMYEKLSGTPNAVSRTVYELSIIDVAAKE